jgi:hypothetical protein
MPQAMPTGARSRLPKLPGSASRRGPLVTFRVQQARLPLAIPLRQGWPAKLQLRVAEQPAGLEWSPQLEEGAAAVVGFAQPHKM